MRLTAQAEIEIRRIVREEIALRLVGTPYGAMAMVSPKGVSYDAGTGRDDPGTRDGGAGAR